MPKHAPHLCYHCSCTINPDEPETRIEGLKSTTIRYRHATDEGCREALKYTGYTRYADPEDDAETLYTGRHRGEGG